MKGSTHRAVTEEHGLVTAVPEREGGREKRLEVAASPGRCDDQEAAHSSIHMDG